jgi:hypothetical protein
MVQQKLNTSEDEHGNRLQEKDNSIFKNQKKNKGYQFYYHPHIHTFLYYVLTVKGTQLLHD